MNLSASEFYSSGVDTTDAVLESAFFAKLKMRNGTFKLTQPSRFQELEVAFRPHAQERAGSLREVLDVGVSTGLTTVELARFLSDCGSAASITATDLFIEAHIVELFPWFRVFCDPGGWPLQYDLRGIAIRPWIRRLDYVTLAFIPLMLSRSILQSRLRSRISAGVSTPVRMVTRSLPPNGAIVFVENDIMRQSERFIRRFDMIRAANILNTGYFSADQLHVAIENIQAYLHGPGALLMIARTNRAGENAATLFELDEEGSFTALERVGGGSEIERLVLDFRGPQPSTAIGALSIGRQ
ncbi:MULTISPECIES: ATP-binding protein [Sinorhizobium]|uniref:ATP-binding protein n=1 Tax=Sinorhizobium TaxID=28105 RepID=UPI000BE985D1|nr:MULTISPECIES: ATP-binding protein [Sinorhizobium]PDT52901.1 ATP-binding protein [Sinorhizobium sp. NG07B]POH29072.1 ATP-binding protein [Sinorhizobium americanum]